MTCTRPPAGAATWSMAAHCSSPPPSLPIMHTPLQTAGCITRLLLYTYIYRIISVAAPHSSTQVASAAAVLVLCASEGVLRGGGCTSSTAYPLCVLLCPGPLHQGVHRRFTCWREPHSLLERVLLTDKTVVRGRPGAGGVYCLREHQLYMVALAGCGIIMLCGVRQCIQHSAVHPAGTAWQVVLL